MGGKEPTHFIISCLVYTTEHVYIVDSFCTCATVEAANSNLPTPRLYKRHESTAVKFEIRFDLNLFSDVHGQPFVALIVDSPLVKFCERMAVVPHL